MPRPAPDEYAPFYAGYVELVPEVEILAPLESEMARTARFLGGIAPDEVSRLHAPYTWTILQVLGHLIDGERIFACRALRFARGDTTPLPGFDENEYVSRGEFNSRTLADLTAEFEDVRRSTLHLFRHFSVDAWSRRGLANGSEVSVRGLAYIVLGHERHHISILRRRVPST